MSALADGAYGVLPFVLAHTIVDAPFMLLQSLVCGGIVYWLVGRDSTHRVQYRVHTNEWTNGPMNGPTNGPSDQMVFIPD